jgi:hypothetical protein
MPSDLRAQLEGFSHPGSPPASGAHNRDREHRSGLFSLERASRLLAIRTLTGQTISAVLQWLFDTEWEDC